MNILIIDDNTDTQELIYDWLNETYKIKAIFASTVREGINKLKAMRFDLIVCDYEMPDGNGGDVLKFIEKEQNLHTPFIMFTGRYDLNFKNRTSITELISDKDYERLFKVIQQQLNLS